ncbi:MULTISPECIES: amino acid ABC transporter permease [unclassified Streptomyces]|uniref:amino acid ABC transporter permease n=1 Tax=unclassified Streptomyces TaxID=2593676 RepID=UPI001F0498D3|nr:MULTISPECIES: amino acid ABC transporter permease [unclassified Streptomyces]MCH0563993.1 amino acid ABC transporter permease [Streptomyces sp. MUM 2J]MCH0569680.1 amino acid ABC transporter permease [Streptomyces sp. MUM 136J]
MTDTVDKAPAPAVPPEQIKAIPVRHYGRWVAGAAVVAILVLIGTAFANAKINYSIIPDYITDGTIVSGAWHTLYISVLAMVLGLALGVILAVMRMSSNPVTSTVSWLYIWFFRGTPVLVQLLLWYNISLVFPVLNLGFYKDEMNQVMTPFLAALLGLGLNEAAYMAEIVRAGIQSVDLGQTEASHALGMTQGQTLRRVILPQAMRVIVPPTGNEFINMLKTSSLAYAVQFNEIIKRAQDISSTSLAVVEMYFVASIWYLMLTSVFSVGQYYLERRYARGSTRSLPPTPLQRLRKHLALFVSFRRPEATR